MIYKLSMLRYIEDIIKNLVLKYVKKCCFLVNPKEENA